MTVSSTTNKQSYNGNGSQSVFAYGFKIFADTDIQVYVGTTLKTLSTHYTLSGVGASGGGNVTFTTGNIPASGTGNVTILRSLALTQGVDLVNYGRFDAEVIESQYDKLVMMVQQLQEQADRTIRFNTTVSDAGGVEITDTVAERSGKVLAYDSSGDLSVADELGEWKGNWATSAAFTARDLVLDAATNNVYTCLVDHTAGTLSSDVAASKWALVINAVAVSTSATNAATSAALSETWATKTDGPVSGGNYSSKYYATTGNVATVSGAIANVNTVAGSIANVNAVAGSIANANTVAANITNMDTVAGISANVTTVAGISANVTSVVNNATNINTNATNIVVIQGASANATTATTQAGIATTKAGNAATSETNAATSASNASSSASNASTSATNASTSETNALASKNSATTSASTATTGASTATTKASEASSSATSAQSSEDDAATSETNAANSATASANSATASSGSATTAANTASSVTNKVDELLALAHLADWGSITDAVGTTTDYGSIV